ncbi:hypothetical protein HZS_5571 [Henneguya salminicola]|nr:hypothetical protein HZS_5571 [Henneguya salminicola]
MVKKRGNYSEIARIRYKLICSCALNSYKKYIANGTKLLSDYWFLNFEIVFYSIQDVQNLRYISYQTKNI